MYDDDALAEIGLVAELIDRANQSADPLDGATVDRALGVELPQPQRPGSAGPGANLPGQPTGIGDDPVDREPVGP